MSTFQKSIKAVLATATDLFEGPATLEGTIYTMTFHNTNASTARAITLSFYDSVTATTTVIWTASIAAGATKNAFDDVGKLNFVAGDKLIAQGDGTGVKAFVSAVVAANVAAAVGFSAEGEYDADTTYAANDYVVDAGILYFSRQNGNIGHTPASSGDWWMPWDISAAGGGFTGDSDDITEGAVNLFMTTSERSKLTAIEASADVTNAVNIASSIVGAANKTTPVDADSFPIINSESANALGELTFSNLKAFLLTYNDTLYAKAGSSFGNDNRIARSDGTGRGIQASAVTIDDSGNVSGVGTFSMSGALTLGADGSTSMHAVSLQQLQAAVLGVGKRARVRLVDTTNSDPATSGYTNGATIDGTTVATGDLILRASSSNQARNGVWVIAASGGASRSAEFDSYDEHPGSVIVATEGTTNADTMWYCTSNAGGTLNSTGIVFAQQYFTAYTAGSSLSLSGNQFSLNLGNANTWSASQTFINSSGIKIRDTDASHTLGIVGGSNLSADRTLTLTTGDANRTISLAGDVTTGGAVTFSGSFGSTFTVTGTTTVTFPTTGTLATLAGTETLTNKRVTDRVGTTTSGSSNTVTPTGDSSDQYNVTAAAGSMTIAAPSGTPTDGQRLRLRIKDSGTARSLSWNSIYRAIGVTLPTTTVISKTLYVGFIYNSADTKWDAVAVGQEA